MDADLQDNPAEIPRLLEVINQGFGLVIGRDAFSCNRNPYLQTSSAKPSLPCH